MIFYCENKEEESMMPCGYQCDTCREQEIKNMAIAFALWMYENRFYKYFGSESENSGKWYQQYSKPDRTYYTSERLYDIFLNKK